MLVICLLVEFTRQAIHSCSSNEDLEGCNIDARIVTTDSDGYWYYPTEDEAAASADVPSKSLFTEYEHTAADTGGDYMPCKIAWQHGSSTQDYNVKITYCGVAYYLDQTKTWTMRHPFDTTIAYNEVACPNYSYLDGFKGSLTNLDQLAAPWQYRSYSQAVDWNCKYINF